MRSIFLSREQVFGQGLPLLETIGAAAPATDLALLTAVDDGFLTDELCINYYLDQGCCVNCFGREDSCAVCAVRPVLLLDEGEEVLLSRKQQDGSLTTVEYGRYPYTILDGSLRDLAAREYARGALPKTGKQVHIAGKSHPLYRLGAKEIVCVAFEEGGVKGFVRLSDGTVVGEGEEVFLEMRPVRWLYDDQRRLLLSCMALFAGLSREQALDYLQSNFLQELAAESEEDLPTSGGFCLREHDELSLIRAYVEADIPVFLHGLSGDGKSDRVRQIDPLALDIELVNETPETINGRAVYNEARNEIVDIKPVWLIKLEQLCEDGKLHILFFDELTNATKQTQSVIFKIVLERFVNNRWPLPPNARIVAAGNDRSESSAAHDLAEPLFGRFAHIYIRTTVENWMPWAVEHKLNPYVMEFLANNDFYMRTPYTGTEGHADPRRWEMVSKVLDKSGNDFSLLAPIVGHETADAFVRFFKAQQQLETLGHYTDAELAKLSVSRRYQLAQQCLYLSAARPKEAQALVTRLGNEYLAWFEYMLQRKSGL
ncbi:MAG: ATP-binding protein [Oscillospiraceae bacterium]|nr:ATP-binding protein [Oscillospiraceae bacterium]